MGEPSYRELLYMLSKEAGEIIRSDFNSDCETKKRWKENNTPVTETDLRVNYLAIAFVKQYFPTYNILGEEESNLTQESDYLWICDPVDGTLAFSHSVPICAFSMALVYKGQAIVGSIYDPFMDRFFYAEKDRGATLNGKPIHVNKRKTLVNQVIGMSGGHNDTINQGRLLNALRAKEAKVINLYSNMYMGALLASGEFAAVIYGGRPVYDGAALKIIIEEAGGKVTNLFGVDQPYDRSILGCVCTNGHIHNQIIEIIEKEALLLTQPQIIPTR
ncbi:inositol monophosphatase [Patescibacteria group bacterium]|nr:inositol monophosphatase [Patescibacteria group bacterium]